MGFFHQKFYFFISKIGIENHSHVNICDYYEDLYQKLQNFKNMNIISNYDYNIFKNYLNSSRNSNNINNDLSIELRKIIYFAFFA
jgi:hypothetical protein